MTRLSTQLQQWLPADASVAARTSGTTHMRRSMQSDALTALFEALPVDASVSDYRSAVVEDNILGQASASGRVNTWKPLRSLYQFDFSRPLFRALRRLWDDAPRTSQPQLALLYALAQDPILRATASPVVESAIGVEVSRAEITAAVEQAWPSRFQPAVLRKIGQYTSQSWQQAGYLDLSGVRVTTRPATADTAAFALLLGHLAGYSGARLTRSPWFTVLGADSHDAQLAARAAQSRGLVEYRSMGGVSEFGFSMLLAPSTSQQERLIL